MRNETRATVKIRERLEVLGIGSNEAARALGISHGAMSDYVRGKTAMGAARALQFAQYLDCTVEDLLELPENPSDD